MARPVGMVLALFSSVFAGLLFGETASSSPSLKYKVIYVEEVPYQSRLYLDVFVSSKTRLRNVKEFEAMICRVIREVQLPKLQKYEGLKYEHIDQYADGFTIRIYYNFDDYAPRGPNPDRVTAKALARELGMYTFDGDTGTGAVRWFVDNPKAWGQPQRATHTTFCKSGSPGGSLSYGGCLTRVAADPVTALLLIFIRW